MYRIDNIELDKYTQGRMKDGSNEKKINIDNDDEMVAMRLRQPLVEPVNIVRSSKQEIKDAKAECSGFIGEGRTNKKVKPSDGVVNKLIVTTRTIGSRGDKGKANTTHSYKVCEHQIKDVLDLYHSQDNSGQVAYPSVVSLIFANKTYSKLSL